MSGLFRCSAIPHHHQGDVVGLEAVPAKPRTSCITASTVDIMGKSGAAACRIVFKGDIAEESARSITAVIQQCG